MGAAPEELAKVPEDGNAGEGAGLLDLPQGVAADPNFPGHVFVLEWSNQRISEYDPWGQFVKAFGWGVDASAPAEALQSCTKATGCLKGKAGSGDGQLDFPEGIAVDGEGFVYVIESENHRIQKFKPDGTGGKAEFVTKFGESGPGELTGGEFAYTRRLAACPQSNDIYVGSGEGIKRFKGDGTFLEEIKGGDLAGESIRGLESDSECGLYAALVGDPEVHKLEGEGATAEFTGPQFKAESPAERPKSVGVDSAGNVYVGLSSFSEGELSEPEKVQAYDAEGHCLTCGKGGEGGKPGFDRSPTTQIEDLAGSGEACEAEDVYAAHFKSSPPQSFFKAYGTPPDTALCPQPVAAPEVAAQFARLVETEKAELKAEINPRFWDDTEYHLEYGTGPCRLGGCTTTTAPVRLTTKVLGHAIPTASVFLAGLQEGTTYHYRFVAESSGGGPAYGIDPDGREGPEEASFEDGLEGTFNTYRKVVTPPCPANAQYRGGASAPLSDCRAYELVSPLDKEGGDIIALEEIGTTLPAVLWQSAGSGDRFAFGSYRSFAGSPSAPFTSQYLASRRTGADWATHPISPPRDQRLVSLLAGFSGEFKAFSDDLCEAWIETFAEQPLAEGAPAGFPDLYRRTDEECGGLAYEALNTTTPPHLEEGPVVTNPEFNLELLGRARDGASAIFLARDSVAAETPEQPLTCVTNGEGCRVQLYGSSEGTERFLCVQPGGSFYAAPCTAGGNTSDIAGNHDREANVTGAISADGRRVFWTATQGGPGRIFMRENPFGMGSECVEPEAPCSRDISRVAEEEAQGGTPKGSQFVAAADNGSRVLFTTQTLGGDNRLYEVEVNEAGVPAAPVLLAHEVIRVMGQSTDAARVYLASRAVMGGANGEGKTAKTGQANLYFLEAGTTHFVATLSSEDLGSPSPLAAFPIGHSARVAPDGLHAAFTSRAQLTGYDNTDQSSLVPCGQSGGICDSEAFLYDATANAGQGGLVCASCNPSGARPLAKAAREGANIPFAAARIPVYENVLYPSRALSDDGSRLFFNATDALVPRDSNGKEDVYQWEAPGAGTCTTTASTYSLQNGGCVDLVSSGQSELGSRFLDASPGGNDVFFTTLSSLVPQDYGLVDVYDARVNGGLPSPPPAAGECEAESCQHPAPAPSFSTPATTSNEGPGNLKPTKHKKAKKKHQKERQKHKKKGKAKKAKKAKHRGAGR